MTTYNTKNPVPSGSAYDRYDNTQVLDELVNSSSVTTPSRLGILLQTWAGLVSSFRNFMQSFGYEALHLTYVAGSPLTVSRPTQLIDFNGSAYAVKQPAVFPVNLTGTWAADSVKLVDVGDAALRSQLATTDSTVVIGGQQASKVGALAGALTVDASGRLRGPSFVAGTKPITGSTVRDAYVVARDIGPLSDCHGFADRTVLDNITDYGGYGSFDCTVSVRGSAALDHAFSFQDRTGYEGSGTLGNMSGLISRPTHSGSGRVLSRVAVDIASIDVTGGGSVNSQIGLWVRDLTAGGTGSVAINMAQTLGYSIYSSGVAPSFHRGNLGLGAAGNAANSGLTFTVQSDLLACKAFITTDATAGSTGVSGNFAYRVVTNGAARLEVGNLAAAYAVRPGADNTQPLGDVSRRWSVVAAGSGTIITSDAREKTEVRALNEAEKRASVKLSKEIGAFKFLDALKSKGDKARDHIGMTVQRAIEIMEENGLDPFGYSFICYDKWDKQIVEHEDHTEVVREEGDRYSFRMDGLLAFIAAGFESRLSALEDPA